MKVKSKKVVAAIALVLAAAASGVASAAQIGQDGLYFSATDTANNNSIIVNLNIDIDDFRASPTTNYTLSGNGLSGLQSWLGTANQAAIQWTVMGVKNDGTGGDIPSTLYGGVSISSDIESVEAGWGLYGGLEGFVTTNPTFLATVNTINNTPGTGLDANNYYVGSGISALNFANIGFDSLSEVGSSVAFYDVGVDQSNPYFGGVFTKYGSWTLSGANGGSLAYASSVVTPPAVPLPAAVWMLGSGLLGLLGVGRRKAAVVAA